MPSTQTAHLHNRLPVVHDQLARTLEEGRHLSLSPHQCRAGRHQGGEQVAGGGGAGGAGVGGGLEEGGEEVACGGASACCHSSG